MSPHVKTTLAGLRRPAYLKCAQGEVGLNETSIAGSVMLFFERVSYLPNIGTPHQILKALVSRYFSIYFGG